MTKTIAQIVTTALDGAGQDYLEDIAAHGIHNITNDFHGETGNEYEAFAAEFELQANAALNDLENARLAEFRAA